MAVTEPTTIPTAAADSSTGSGSTGRNSTGRNSTGRNSTGRNSTGTAGLQLGRAVEDWTGDARFFEYSRAADPIGSGDTPLVPMQEFGPELHEGGPTRIVPLDCSPAMGTTGPATSPALLASFVHILPGEHVATAPRASSELYYVLRGRGASEVDGGRIAWSAGDFVTLPADCPATHRAETDTAMYWVTDEPLLRFLGATATERRFAPTRFDGNVARDQLEAVASDPDAGDRSRVSVLLANANQTQTLTVTHTLWAMLGLLPAGSVQRPHRHQSVALDLIVDCLPGCYSLVGDHLDDEGGIIDPTRVDWVAGGAFVTPPGRWHAHHNESGADARLIPVQDAGLQTYLRSLDIRFAPRMG